MMHVRPFLCSPPPLTPTVRTAPTEAVCARGVRLCVHAMGRLAARGNRSLELEP